uniref:Uncharacterized protein n=1 Tax=Chlamydomonas leiostraca TaxID=1034604 RepID=A0A7S0RQX0_9CHLO|mmetsp:Transcript_29360/g.74831  ORF Transcript_29360/g.74831 Transcript_29360/m.74831 type:complete len:350 (+) Transcript_29360:89-1138(+)
MLLNRYCHYRFRALQTHIGASFNHGRQPGRRTSLNVVRDVPRTHIARRHDAQVINLQSTQSYENNQRSRETEGSALSSRDDEEQHGAAQIALLVCMSVGLMSIKWAVQTGPLALIPAGLLMFAPVTGTGLRRLLKEGARDVANGLRFVSTHQPHPHPQQQQQQQQHPGDSHAHQHHHQHQQHPSQHSQPQGPHSNWPRPGQQVPAPASANPPSSPWPRQSSAQPAYAASAYAAGHPHGMQQPGQHMGQQQGMGQQQQQAHHHHHHHPQYHHHQPAHDQHAQSPRPVVFASHTRPAGPSQPTPGAGGPADNQRAQQARSAAPGQQPPAAGSSGSMGRDSKLCTDLDILEW